MTIHEPDLQVSSKGWSQISSLGTFPNACKGAKINQGCVMTSFRICSNKLCTYHGQMHGRTLPNETRVSANAGVYEPSDGGSTVWVWAFKMVCCTMISHQASNSNIWQRVVSYSSRNWPLDLKRSFRSFNFYTFVVSHRQPGDPNSLLSETCSIIINACERFRTFQVRALAVKLPPKSII